MAVPKRRKSKMKTRSRRSENLKLSLPSYQTCKECGAPKKAHRACGYCGVYRNEEVIEIFDLE